MVGGRRHRSGSKSSKVRGGKYTATEKKLVSIVNRGNRAPPKTAKGLAAYYKAAERLEKSLGKKKHLDVPEGKILRLLSGKGKRRVVKRKVTKRKVTRGSKAVGRKKALGRRCDTLKTQFRKDVCYYNKGNPNLSYKRAVKQFSPIYKKMYAPERTAKRKVAKAHGRKPCGEQNNPWLFWLCDFREKFGDEPQYQGQQGNRDLMRDAGEAYRTAQGAGEGYSHHY